MKDHIDVLLSEAQIEARIAELAAAINRDYAGKNVVLLGTLKGAYIFMADISRKLTIPTQIDFITVSSYGDTTTSSTQVKFDQEPSLDLSGKHVILIEDIVDTGHTLVFLRKYLLGHNPASLTVCALLDKPERREVSLPACEYLGFSIPNEFVVGYGLDFAQQYRNLPYIGILKQG